MVALPPVPSWSHHRGFCPCARSHPPPRSLGVRMRPLPVLHHRMWPWGQSVGMTPLRVTCRQPHASSPTQRGRMMALAPPGGSVPGGVGASCAASAALARWVPARKEAMRQQSGFPEMGGPGACCLPARGRPPCHTGDSQPMLHGLGWVHGGGDGHRMPWGACCRRHTDHSEQGDRMQQNNFWGAFPAEKQSWGAGGCPAGLQQCTGSWSHSGLGGSGGTLAHCCPPSTYCSSSPCGGGNTVLGAHPGGCSTFR